MLKKLFTKLFKPATAKTSADKKRQEIDVFKKKIGERLTKSVNSTHSKYRQSSSKDSPSNFPTDSFLTDYRSNEQDDKNKHSKKSHRSSNNRYRTNSQENKTEISEHRNKQRRTRSRKLDDQYQGRYRGQKNERRPREKSEDDTRRQISDKSKASNGVPSSVFDIDKFFKNMGISETLSTILANKGFVHPSKAQAETLPIILEGKNLICSSETGSGKTLAFSIPVLERLITKKIDQACVLTPTREIAIQIESVIKPIAQQLGITTGLAIGGLDMLVQKNILREYPQILIATPGRLVDVLTQGLVWLDYTQVVVLDEVDRMLDMGFEKEITTLFDNFPNSAQILMFTATMNKELEKLSQKYVKNYELIKIGETMKTKNSIEHLFLSISPKEKYDLLKKTLLRKRNEKILVFCNSIDDTASIFRMLKKDRLTKIECLHSKKTQAERNSILDGFRSNRINHLLTTDVLARGIDIPDIEAVINYELPYDPEDYVHRIGRTGRADFTGKALSFVDARSELKLKKIKQLIKSDSGFTFIHREALETF